MAIILALVFAHSACYAPKVGGPFAYVSEAFNDFWGFLAGWSMWIAELISLPVFAITFTNYLQYFVTLSFSEQLAVKALHGTGHPAFQYPVSDRFRGVQSQPLLRK